MTLTASLALCIQMAGSKETVLERADFKDSSSELSRLGCDQQTFYFPFLVTKIPNKMV